MCEFTICSHLQSERLFSDPHYLLTPALIYICISSWFKDICRSTLGVSFDHLLPTFSPFYYRYAFKVGDLSEIYRNCANLQFVHNRIPLLCVACSEAFNTLYSSQDIPASHYSMRLPPTLHTLLHQIQDTVLSILRSYRSHLCSLAILRHSDERA